MTARSTPRVAGRFSVAEFALTITALGGITSLLWMAASALLGLSLISFRTGSMSPTMPTGTLAVAVTVPAQSVEKGDVVTVTRKDSLPITHRVVSAAHAEGEAAQLVLKGDDNQQADPDPYLVTEVRRVEAWIPGAARYWELLRSPSGLGLATIGVGILLTVALLPRRTSGPPRSSLGGNSRGSTSRG